MTTRKHNFRYKMCFLFELFFLVDFLHEAALSLPNSCHFYSKNDAFLQNYFAQVHCEKIQGFNRKNAFWCYFHFEWVLKLSKLSISCSVMCQKVKESDFHFPTRYLLLLYTLEIVWGSTNYSYKLPARQKKRHWEQQVLMNALCVDGNTIVLYSM